MLSWLEQSIQAESEHKYKFVLTNRQRRGHWI